MTQEEAQQFINELAARNNLAPEASDVANLVGKNPEDVAKFQSDLEIQSKARTSNSSGSSQTEYAAPNNTPAPVANVAAPAAAPAPSNPLQSWSQTPDTFTNAMTEQNRMLKEMQDESRARQATITAKEAADTAKRDELYKELVTRSQKGLQVNASDPVIKGQVDSYRAEQERARRNYVSDAAERGGPLGNIRGEERMASERTGINTASYQAELLSRRLESERSEIAAALNSRQGMLSADQEANLQRELDSYDNRLAELGMRQSGINSSGQLGLGYAGLGVQQELGQGNLALGQSDLALRTLLGNRNLDLQSMQQEIGDRQFYDDLGLRAGDRSSYWDYMNRYPGQ